VNTNSYVQGNYLGTASYYKPEGLPAPFYFIQYYNIGYYFQTQYSPSRNIHFTLGARYDRNSRFGSSFNPRLGIVYKPSDKSTFKLLYGSAFRAPAPSDSYAQYGSFDTPDSGRTYHSYFLHLPNPGLKPIKSQNIELNFQQQISANLLFTLDGYYTRYSGLYSFADDNQSTHLYNNNFNGIPVDYIEVFVNNDRQKNYGGSLQVNWKQTFRKIHFNAFASLSYVNGVKETGLKERLEKIKDVQLEFIAPLMIHLGTDLKSGKFTCSPRLILMGKQNIAGISDTTGAIIKRQTIPGYALLNISLRYNISRQFSMFTNVSNALNQRYTNVSFNMDLTKKDTELYYGQPQDPIRIMGGLNFSF
ncbi:MAG: TonB-dependent receptor, partial [Bacteroidota bacterium]